MAIIRVLAGLAIWLVTLPFRLVMGWLGIGGNVVHARSDDAALNAAKAQAVATIPEFLRRIALPGANLESAAIKAPLPVTGGQEHVWLRFVRHENGEFVGIVDNTPRHETNVKAGDTIRIRETEISDWKLVERAQLIGGFTIRYFMDRMPARQRNAMIASLPFAIGPEPIPPGL